MAARRRSVPARSIRYVEIADTLRKRIAKGRYSGVTVLPSESELSEEFAASRVTIRRALETLRDEEIVHAGCHVDEQVATDDALPGKIRSPRFREVVAGHEPLG